MKRSQMLSALAVAALLDAGVVLAQSEPKPKTEATTTDKAAEEARETKREASREAGKAEPPAADDTGRNKRDREDKRRTSGDQSNTGSDIEIAAQIRRSIVKDKELSTNAHNVKVIVEGGTATLRGPVESPAEKTAVVKKASAVVGADKVKDEIEVKR